MQTICCSTCYWPSDDARGSDSLDGFRPAAAVLILTGMAAGDALAAAGPEGGGAGLPDGPRRAGDRPPRTCTPRAGPRAAALSGRMALSLQRQPGTHLHPAQPRGPGVHPLHQPVRLPGRPLACGACHQDIIEASIRSLHATGAMLWGGAAYNNGILPFKNYILGEAYTEDGEAPCSRPGAADRRMPRRTAFCRGCIPLPAWETVKPGDVFRVFERGGRNITNLFPETGLPNALGLLQRIEEPGRPDIRQSNRGPGTGARISVPVINITKTRLNDPNTWFSAPTTSPATTVPRAAPAATWCTPTTATRATPAPTPNSATGQDADRGPDHPEGRVRPSAAAHRFTRAIPTSQCMICHMHQPNMFVNSYLGYTMWDYESDAPHMWPEEQQYPEPPCARCSTAIPRGRRRAGKWGDVDFLKGVSELNPQLSRTPSSPTTTATAGTSARSSSATARATCWMPKANRRRRRPRQVRQGRAHVVDPRGRRHALRRLPLLPGQPRQRPHLRRGGAGGGDRLRTATAPPGVSEPLHVRSGRPAGGADLSGCCAIPTGAASASSGRRQALPALHADPELEWEMSLVKDS
jgi:hypothetical protein